MGFSITFPGDPSHCSTASQITHSFIQNVQCCVRSCLGDGNHNSRMQAFAHSSRKCLDCVPRSLTCEMQKCTSHSAYIKHRVWPWRQQGDEMHACFFWLQNKYLNKNVYESPPRCFNSLAAWVPRQFVAKRWEMPQLLLPLCKCGKSTSNTFQVTSHYK